MPDNCCVGFSHPRQRSQWVNALTLCELQNGLLCKVGCKKYIHNLRIEKGTGAKIKLTGDAPVSYWPVFYPVPSNNPRSLCEINLAQSPHLLSSEFPIFTKTIMHLVYPPTLKFRITILQSSQEKSKTMAMHFCLNIMAYVKVANAIND